MAVPTKNNATSDFISPESRPSGLRALLKAASTVRPNHDMELISRAYAFAERVHRDQYRKSGQPYIHHVTQVANILAELNLDSATVAAGLLHDVVESTSIPLDEIEAEFGKEMASLVDGVTRIKDLTFQSPEAEQAENFRKMLLSTVSDIRVVLIKFADRLHNLSTLRFLTPEIQQRMALESRDIYAPLAHRLGMARIRAEMEDMSLKWLDPETYEAIERRINLTKEEREAYIEEARQPIKQALDRTEIEADIQGRPKSYYSITSKRSRRGMSIDEMYDLMALRVIVNTVPECYEALGIVHSLYTPMMARFKDFIATPKANMYQSLHTTIIGPKGMMMEVQIRTWKMHRTAEVGIAAHWRYKEGRQAASDLDPHVAWLRDLLEWIRETPDPKEFMEDLKVDLFPGEIFVFTPKGDLIRLPEGATPIDFAFAIHTDVGFRCTGARVKGQIVPLSTALETGNTVEVTTAPHQHPSRDWLNFAKSTKARSSIRRWLREETHAQSARLGRDLVARELKKRRKRVEDEKLRKVAIDTGYADTEHLYAGIGNGDVTLEKVFHRLFPKARPARRLRRAEPSRQDPRSPINLRGLNNLLTHFARCCRPIPGDPVLGIITRGRGVSVHRRDCPNVQSSGVEKDRIVNLDWDHDEAVTLPIVIRVSGEDRPNFLRDVTNAVADQGIPVVEGELKTVDGRVGDQFLVEVKSRNQLAALFKKLLEVPGVMEVRRVDETGDE